MGADGVILDLGAEGLKEKMAAEPDFVVFKVWKEGFESVRELTDWYNDFFLIQSAAWIMEDGVPTEELRTDFVIK